MSNVRVRFAPSPTGFFHIGSARTALFNWLYARHTRGTFILRIEDTDVSRNTSEALRVLLNGMRWLGLDWDEGPDKPGPFGPYFQSERDNIYKKYLEKLKTTGRVYEKEGALYFKVSGEAQWIEDVIRGNVYRKEEKDFIIIRSNGTPVFHFVNVVDDIDMQITHIIRGEDHLSNTSKHIELFNAFGVKPPVFAHIPLILKTNGPGKMSKRDSGSLVDEYQKRNFLPHALRNYLCLLGWSPKDDTEILSLEEMIAKFDLPQINKNNARFDDRKLSYINSEYLRRLSSEDFCNLAKPILSKAIAIENSTNDYFASVMAICQEKVRSIEELPSFCEYFFHENYSIDEAVATKLLQQGNLKAILNQCLNCLKNIDSFTPDNLEEALKSSSENSLFSIGQCITAIRLAVSGKNIGPAFYFMLAILGKNKVLARMERYVKSLDTRLAY